MRPPPKRPQPLRQATSPPPPPPRPPLPPEQLRPGVGSHPLRAGERSATGHVDVALEQCSLTRDGDKPGAFNGVLRITNHTGLPLHLVMIRVEFIVNSMEVGSIAEDANLIADGQDRRWPFSTHLLSWFKEAEPPFEWNALVQSDGSQVPVHLAGVSWAQQSNCYVVTACADDPRDDTVQAFREFRELCLVPSRLGRRFISLYDRIGPPCALVIRDRPWLRKVSRRVLVALTPTVKLQIRRAAYQRLRSRPRMANRQT
jgi:hypothetical protein